MEKAIAKFAAKQKRIVAAYIFGSYVKGKQTKSSDLDIGLVYFDKTGLSQPKLAAEIQRLVGNIEVDVSVVDLTSDPLLLIQIINGKVIFQRSAQERIELETRVLHLYEDSVHLRNIENYYLAKSFKEGVYAH